MRRILMLEGTPDMRADDLEVGSTVPEMIEADLKLEYKVRGALCKGIELCELHKDYVSRDILRAQLADTEEDHTYWLEKQQGLIKAIGWKTTCSRRCKLPTGSSKSPWHHRYQGLFHCAGNTRPDPAPAMVSGNGRYMTASSRSALLAYRRQ